MIKKKIKLYYRVLVHIFFNYLYGKILIPKNKGSLLKKIEINHKSFKSFQNKNYHIYTVKDARIFTDNNENVAIIKNNKILPKISFQQIRGNLRSIKFNSVIKQGTTSFIKKVKGKVFNLCQGGSGNNYFHFIFDILPKLYLLNSKINLNKIDFFYFNFLHF